MNKERIKLIRKIFDITAVIQNSCPQLYMNLTETPLFISYEESEIKNIDYKRYLDFLIIQLEEFSKDTLSKDVNNIINYKTL